MVELQVHLYYNDIVSPEKGRAEKDFKETPTQGVIYTE